VTGEVTRVARIRGPAHRSKDRRQGHDPHQDHRPGWAHRATTPGRVLQQACERRVYAPGPDVLNHPSKPMKRTAGTRPPRQPSRVLTEDAASGSEHGQKARSLCPVRRCFPLPRRRSREWGRTSGLSHYVWGESKTARRRGRRVTSSPGSSPPARRFRPPWPARGRGDRGGVPGCPAPRTDR